MPIMLIEPLNVVSISRYARMAVSFKLGGWGLGTGDWKIHLFITLSPHHSSLARPLWHSRATWSSADSRLSLPCYNVNPESAVNEKAWYALTCCAGYRPRD